MAVGENISRDICGHAGAPDGNIRLFCKGSDSKVLAMLRPEAGGGKAGAGGLKAATHENLHIFATHVRGPLTV